MSDLLLAKPTELTDAELDMVAAGAQYPNISINVQLANNISVQNAIALNVLSPGAVALAKNLNLSWQGNFIS